MRKKLVYLLILPAFLFFLTTPAIAIPVLQLYLEGGAYDSASEDWVLEPNGDPIVLWVIGNISGPGGHGNITGVNLAAAYDAADSPTITLTPTTIGAGSGSFMGFTDASEESSTGTLIQTVTDGSSPLLSDGSSLPSHGIYGLGTDWQEFDLGNFTAPLDPIGDFINSFPSPVANNAAQINAYNVSISGTGRVHFDAYDEITLGGGKTKAKFAPFSHDATVVPEPATVLLLGGGLIGLALLGMRRSKNRKA